MQIHLPELSVIILVGNDESGKRAFCKRNFKKEESVRMDDLENLELRLKEGKLSVVNLGNEDDNTLDEIVHLARKFHVTLTALLFQDSLAESKKQSVKSQVQFLKQKGIKKIEVLEPHIKTEHIKINRLKSKNDKKELHGPFDMIGDIHGCYDELCALLIKLGYEVEEEQCTAYSPANRKVVFLGDLVDRGPKITEVLKLVMQMVRDGQAYCVLGNHDGKLQRKLHGSNVKVIHGLENTMEQLAKESNKFKDEVREFLDKLVSHYVFDEGNLVVAHAGLKEKFHGRESGKIRDLAMYGETTGQLDAYGLPVRLDWSKDYKGTALVVYGHTPQANVRVVNNTVNIDTGCIFGGYLTAFRYPEKEIVQVKAKQTYYESPRPFL